MPLKKRKNGKNKIAEQKVPDRPKPTRSKKKDIESFPQKLPDRPKPKKQ